MGAFLADIDRFVNQAKESLNDKAKYAVYRLCAEIVYRTPVRTGQARGNWICHIGDQPIREKTGNLDPTGVATMLKIAEEIEKFQIGKTKKIWLTNVLPYILRLEYGYSKQSPSGMIRISVANFRGIEGWL